ncbi:DUF4105 domain-containing protein [Rugamonas sp. CCM 8940]|uniref:Lnb N-terminal periplasmic domain-containing protein n=1 Tax=Rugamonas sp. CCM 8940 TaxID=2765359 RepID=UPI0018F4F239|nr:DUF4105 domain-containing protein [Rugamonas sp. CCM 8940]
MKKSLLRSVLMILASLLLLLLTGWGALALWFQLPAGAAARWAALAVWVAAGMATLICWWRGGRARVLLPWLLAFALLLAWWSTIAPAQQRNWAADVDRMAGGRVDGGIVTLAQVRNFDWRSDADFTQRWEQRRYDLDRLRSVDVALSYWMGPAIAHTLVSFGFDDGRYLTFSIEIRKERGESFSALAGFFKRYETVLVAADERDILWVRTNVRGEDMYLYRLKMAPAAMRSLFLAYLDEGAQLRRAPRFYNTLTANCTTIVFEMARRIDPGLPFDWRLLASGYLDRYLFDIGALAGSAEFARLRETAHITARARAADKSEDFSASIRR